MEQKKCCCSHNHNDLKQNKYEEVFKKYDNFYSKYIQSRNAKRNPAVDLKREFGHTFWYYLMFNK